MKSGIAVVSDFHPNDVLGGGGLIGYEYHKLMVQEEINSLFIHLSESISTKPNEINLGRPRVIKSKVRRYFRENFGLFQLVEFVKAVHRADVEMIWVHQIGKQIPFLCIPIAKLLRKNVVFTAHDFLTISTTKVSPLSTNRVDVLARENVVIPEGLHSRIRRIAIRHFVNSADAIIAVSDMQSQILRNFGINVTGVINNGIENCDHDYSEKVPHSDVPTILFAGRLHSKGLRETLESLTLFKGETRIFLAGERELLDFTNLEFPHLAFEYLGLLDRSTLANMIHECDCVFVLSQYFDPFPTIALESARHSVPFICTNTSGVSALIPEKWKENLVFKVGEIPDIEKILKFIRSEEFNLNEISRNIHSARSALSEYLTIFEEISR